MAAATGSTERTTGTITTSAASAALGCAAACWLWLPHFLQPAWLATLVLFTGFVLVALAFRAILSLLGIRPGGGSLAVLSVAPLAVAAAGIAAFSTPWLLGGSRLGLIIFGLSALCLSAAAAWLLGRFASHSAAATVVVGLLAVAIGSASSTRLHSQPVDSVRVLLVGFDGMTWKVATPLLRAGRLPTMRHVLRTGATGILESQEPTLSPRVWTTLATGKSPTLHHIMDFETPQTALRAARVWEILEGEGHSVGVFGYLVTWPPGPHRGFLVPGWEARGPGATPSELSFVRANAGSLRDALAIGSALIRHGVRLQSLVDEAIAVVRYRAWTEQGYAAAAAFAQLSLEADVFLDALRRHRPELAIFVVSGSDTVSHLYWEYMDARHFPHVPAIHRQRFGDVIPRYYREADRTLGRLMAAVAPSAHTFVISDHGNGPKPASQATRAVRTASLLQALELSSGEVSATTIAGATHLVARDVQARDEIRRKLGEFRYAASGAPAFETTVEGATGLKILALPSRDPEARLLVNGRTMPASELVRDAEFSGDHTRQGILLAGGPGVQARARIRRARIHDVTPTLLALFDLPPADDMEGRVLPEIARDPSERGHRIATWNHHLPRFEEAHPSLGRDVEDRLRALGYL